MLVLLKLETKKGAGARRSGPVIPQKDVGRCQHTSVSSQQNLFLIRRLGFSFSLTRSGIKVKSPIHPSVGSSWCYWGNGTVCLNVSSSGGFCRKHFGGAPNMSGLLRLLTASASLMWLFEFHSSSYWFKINWHLDNVISIRLQALWPPTSAWGN